MIDRLQIRRRHVPTSCFDARHRDYRGVLRGGEDGQVQDTILLRAHEFFSVHEEHRKVCSVFKTQLRNRSTCVKLCHTDLALRDSIFQQQIVQLLEGNTSANQWKQSEISELRRLADLNARKFFLKGPHVAYVSLGCVIHPESRHAADQNSSSVES